VSARTQSSVCPPLPFELRFTELIASQNRTTYAHWTVYAAEKRRWKAEAAVVMRPLSGLRFEWSRWSLLRRYAGRKREMDMANLVGGAKPLIDQLTEMEVIVDDAPAHFSCAYAQQRSDENLTVLTLLEYR